jgi:hypothetical protein
MNSTDHQVSIGWPSVRAVATVASFCGRTTSVHTIRTRALLQTISAAEPARAIRTAQPIPHVVCVSTTDEGVTTQNGFA